MSAESGAPGDHTDTSLEGVLSESVAASNRVQEIGGSLYVPIPKNSARDLGLYKGESVLFLGQVGDESLEVGRPERVLDD